MAKIRFRGRTFNLPANRAVRIGVAFAFILFGLLGFLPLLGFWMVPLGILILSYDFAIARRWRRRATVSIMRGRLYAVMARWSTAAERWWAALRKRYRTLSG